MQLYVIKSGFSSSLLLYLNTLVRSGYGALFLTRLEETKSLLLLYVYILYIYIVYIIYIYIFIHIYIYKLFEDIKMLQSILSRFKYFIKS